MNIKGVARIIICSLVIIGAIVIIAAIFIPPYIDVSRYVPEMEAKLSDSMGVNVIVDGRAGLSILPSPGFKLSDAALRAEGLASLDAQEIEGRVAILPLLSGNVVVSEITFSRPRLSVQDYPLLVRTLKSMKHSEGTGALKIESISIDNGETIVKDDSGRTVLEASGLDIFVDDLKYGSKGAPVSLDGELSADSVKAGGLEVSAGDSRFSYKDRILKAPGLLIGLFDGTSENSLTIDVSGKVPRVVLKEKAKGLNLGKITKVLYGKGIANGSLDVRMEINASGGDLQGLLRSADGRIHASGRDIKLTGVDVDRIVERIKDNEEIDLVDIGSFLLVGPIGSVVTKGYDITASYLAVKEGGSTGIALLNADWILKNGVANAEDVAFRTSKNRIALKGHFNLVEKQFKDLEVAVLDRRGCAIYIQKKTDGPFRSLWAKGEPLVRTVIAPVKKVLDVASEVLMDKKCDRFYTGVVQHP